MDQVIKTGEIAKNLAEEDERICVYQLENRGVSAARILR